MLSRPTIARPMRLGTLKVVEPLPLPQGMKTIAVEVVAPALLLRVKVVPDLDETVVPATKQAEPSMAPPIGIRLAISAETVMLGDPEEQEIVAVADSAENKLA